MRRRQRGRARIRPVTGHCDADLHSVLCFEDRRRPVLFFNFFEEGWKGAGVCVTFLFFGRGAPICLLYHAIFPASSIRVATRDMCRLICWSFSGIRLVWRSSWDPVRARFICRAESRFGRASAHFLTSVLVIASHGPLQAIKNVCFIFMALLHVRLLTFAKPHGAAQRIIRHISTEYSNKNSYRRLFIAPTLTELVICPVRSKPIVPVRPFRSYPFIKKNPFLLTYPNYSHF